MNKSFIITDVKKYVDIPIGHRQHLHDGHCAWIHGHNWDFELTFSASKLDRLGFVVDFGKLKFIKDWIEEKLDHAFMVAEDDKELFPALELLTEAKAVKILMLPNTSAEGLAKYILQNVNRLLQDNIPTDVDSRDLGVHKIRLWEDSHNSVEVLW